MRSTGWKVKTMGGALILAVLYGCGQADTKICCGEYYGVGNSGAVNWEDSNDEKDSFICDFISYADFRM